MRTEQVTDQGGPEVFLTAYDPTDLPGTSVDPLGFERAYLFLADRILPGLTNVVGVARYFSVFCAGAALADVDPAAPLRSQATARRDAIMRLERIWALSNLAGAPSEEQGRLQGIRGIRYVQAVMGRLQGGGDRNVNLDFKLLARQATYGVLGIYGSVAEGLRLIDRSSYSLTPGLGDRLGEAFVRATKMPDSIRAAVTSERPLRLEVLMAWGREASILNPLSPSEATPLREALFNDPVRRRMCELLLEVPSSDGEDEVTWMSRLRDVRAGSRRDQDLVEALAIVLAFERCYRLTMLGLTRLLIMCRSSATGAVDRAARRSDGVLSRVARDLPAAVGALERALREQRALDIGGRPERLEDVLSFVRDGAAAADPLALANVIVQRHADIQRGKFDGGRRKSAWLEEQEGSLALTPSRVPETPAEVSGIDDIRPHAYRAFTAERLLLAIRSAAN